MARFFAFASVGQRLRPLVSVFLVFTALAVVSLGAHDYVELRRLQKRAEESVTLVSRAYSIDNFHIEGYVDVDKRDPQSDLKWILLTVARGDSAICGEAASRWRSLVPDAPATQFWHVGVDGFAGTSAFVDALRTSGVTYRLSEVRDRERFRMTTGIVTVPMTLLMSRTGTISVVIPGVPSSDDARLIKEVIRGAAKAPNLFSRPLSGAVESF